MPTTALAPRAAPSLYQGMILALIACAFALQASFLAGLARGAGGFAARPVVAISAPASPASSSSPCPIP
jgi:uncharacterized RDD family membrane protein YckC